MNKYFIYSLNEPESDIVRYIGFTGKSLEHRFNQHIREKENYRRCKWISSLKKKDLLPSINLIDSCDSLEEVKQKEIHYIKLFKSFGAILVNGTNGGDLGNTGIKFSEESRKKMSRSRLGVTPWNKGIPMSDEARLKLSNSKKGSVAHNKGKKMNPDQIKKISERRKGKWIGNTLRLGKKPYNHGKSKYDLDMIINLKSQGISTANTAKIIGCSEWTVKNAYKKHLTGNGYKVTASIGDFS